MDWELLLVGMFFSFNVMLNCLNLIINIMVSKEWLNQYLIMVEDAPEILMEFCMSKATELGVSYEYFIEEFLP